MRGARISELTALHSNQSITKALGAVIPEGPTLEPDTMSVSLDWTSPPAASSELAAPESYSTHVKYSCCRSISCMRSVKGITGAHDSPVLP